MVVMNEWTEGWLKKTFLNRAWVSVACFCDRVWVVFDLC
jgi:hypothetical protein